MVEYVKYKAIISQGNKVNPAEHTKDSVRKNSISKDCKTKSVMQSDLDNANSRIQELEIELSETKEIAAYWHNRAEIANNKLIHISKVLKSIQHLL